MRVVSLILGIVCLGFAFNASAKPVFMGLGDLPGGNFYSRARGVSADGSVVVGFSASASGTEAFRWTQGGGMVGLGDLPGADFKSRAYGVSADGSVVVGTSDSASGQEAFRWTQGGGMVGLGDFRGGNFLSRANGVSASGAVVVGTSISASGWEAFRRHSFVNLGDGQTYSFMVGLGDLPGGDFYSNATAVSADGSVVVGHSNSASGREAFLYDKNGSLQTVYMGLGDLPGGPFWSEAHAVSADGSVVVGHSDTASGYEAFRWTQGSGMVGLGQLVAGHDSVANAVSADGSVVVGEGWIDHPDPFASDALPEAVIWFPYWGIREVDEVLTALGADLTGWTLTRALGISADGLTIVGEGRNPDGDRAAWIANLPCGLCEVDPIADSPDQDDDNVADRSDNCVADANPEQVDSDGDGYGNLCDADYDGDGVVSGRDFLLFRSTFGKRASQRGFLAAADADGDGVIAGADFLAFRAQYQRGAPGP